MDKKVKWGIVILVGAGLIGWGIYSRLPKANEELAAADKVMTVSSHLGPSCVPQYILAPLSRI